MRPKKREDKREACRQTENKGINVTQVGQKPVDKDGSITATEGHGGSPAKSGIRLKIPAKRVMRVKRRQEKGKEPCQENVKSPAKELRRQDKGKEPCQGSHNMTTRSMSPAKTWTAEGCYLRSGKQISKLDVGQKMESMWMGEVGERERLFRKRCSRKSQKM
ncbi:ClpV1 family T6SS ATPase [Sesbania bispinosa]|nr:ClpV1 family T6SS ATPase [Sesbania bispinosa]